ncbi:hypothetical protein [Candidatus Poriferisodalis sp.]|uniref:hypothetical protein n=1 Tax=Candidatus Poriferisodalis sp. TaxID=3101277 RepID=UPI003B0232F1
MTGDIDTGTISPPQRQVEKSVDVRELTETELGAHVNDLLASVGEAPSGPSSSVASLAAVWAISQVEKECGVGPFVDPKELTKDDLATPAALGRMLHREIRKQAVPLFKS